MAEVKLNVNETKLIITSPITLVSTGVNYDTCRFSFGPEWEGYTKTAVFYSDINTEPISMILSENDICTIPWESMDKPGILYIGVFGIKDNIEIPTNFVTLRLIQGAAGNNAPPPPSLSVYKQILDKVTEVKAVVESFNAAELERKTNEEERQQSYLEFKGDIQSGTGLKNELKTSITTGVELDNKLKENISSGNTLDLNLKDDINLGDALDLKLKEDIATGNTLKTEIKKDIEEAAQVKAETEQLIQSGGAATKGDVQEVNAHLEQTTKMKRSLINERGIQDSIYSLNNSRIGYEDSQETIFTENWDDISQWKTQVTPGVQVLNNALFSTGLQGGGSGANHSYKLNDNENLRAVFKVNLNTFPTNGGVMIGVSNDEPDAIPKNAGGSAFALYLSGGGNANSMNLGVQGNTAEGLKYSTGEYIVTVTVDKKYISIVASKTDNMLEISCRRLREGFNVNNLYIFNSDANALNGVSIGFCSARKGLQTIKSNNYGEGIVKTVQWTGDGTQSFRIYLPKDYDCRKPSPLVICFHGNGTSEINWSTGFGDNNYGRLQRALTEKGYIVLGCSLNSSTTTWGNKLSTNAYYEAYKYVRDNYSIGSVVIFANSMGGIESLNAISENKIPCVAWAGTVPVFNLKNVYQNSLFTNGIKGAYGISSDGSDYDVKTEGRDPNLMSGYAFRGIPMWIASPNDDDKVSKVENTDKLIEKVKDISVDLRIITVPNGMAGHSFNIQPYLDDIITFFNEYVRS